MSLTGLTPGPRSRTGTAPDEEAALETFFQNGWTDGLPVVIPTPERVENMLVFTGGLDRDVIVGVLGPAQGEATVEKIAVNAVMAGCLPEYMPILIAAVEAVADPEFNLGPIQATTHGAGPVIFVNGPARLDCSIQSGTGALGPGYRANATIGRALRLVLMNIGGGRPGSGDMALFGQPGKFTCCMAEAEEESPFEPLHVSRGYSPETSTVTVLAAEAPHSVICLIDPDAPDNADRILRVLAEGLANMASNPIYMRRGMNAVILNPDHADELAKAGLGRREIQERLFELAVRRRGDLRRFGGPLVDEGDDDDLLTVVQDPSDFLVLVGGGRGLYSMVVNSWGGGPMGNIAITKPVREEKACLVPLSSG